MKGGEMMKNHTKLTRSLATVATVGILLTAAAPAFAQTTNSQSHVGFFQGLIQFIEQKFGLDQNQVQSAVQQYKSQRSATITPRPTLTQEQMSNREKARLDKLVSNNKITSAQETAILNELSAEQSKYNLSSETPQQRRSSMQSMRSDLQTWAQANSINPMYVMPFGAMRGGKGMMPGRHGGWNPSGTPAPSVTPTPGS
jgi:hypothetical protein